MRKKIEKKVATVENCVILSLEEDFGEILKVLGFVFRVRSIFAKKLTSFISLARNQNLA